MLVLTAQDAPAFDNWVSRRDSGVVRQSLDYSCGLAALATVLTHYYDTPVSERALLSEFRRFSAKTRSSGVDAAAGLSFEDLARLARGHGYRALGLSLGFTELQRLRRPAIVALDLGARRHFSVLRRAGPQSVSLADPSWGNRSMHRQAFIERFLNDANGTRGRALLILRQDAAAGRPSFLEARSAGAQLAPGLLNAAN